MRFKVGDRVRINHKQSLFHLREAVIWKIAKSSHLGFGPPIVAYFVDIDGQGKLSPRGINNGFEEHELEPLVPPDELAWQKFREHLRPNPLVIFDADPIIVSTDEEAARIAETVPNSHIKVVIRGVVVSEYYGQSQTNRP